MFGNAVTLLTWTAIVALTAAGLIQLVRQIPWVDRQMLAGRKPWVCDLCMSWWSALLGTTFWLLLDGAPWRASIPAFALTMLVVRSLGAPVSDLQLNDIPDIGKEIP